MQIYSQGNLLSEIDFGNNNNVFHSPAFKSFRIGNLQSTKVAHTGDLYLNVSHRFGSIKGGVDTFWGLDEAITKIQFIYGVFGGVHVSVSRESFRKTYAGAIKFELLSQTTNFPLNITAYSTANINTELKKERYPLLTFADRLSYASQLLLSHKFTNSLSLEIAPTYVRQNLEFTEGHDHDLFALGVGGRLKLSTRVALNIDYIHNFVRHKSSVYKNPLTIGLDIETGGHVFQLVFSNSQSSNEPAFLSNANGDWSKAEVFFGFNLVRVF